jgi:hypothetical protein
MAERVEEGTMAEDAPVLLLLDAAGTVLAASVAVDGAHPLQRVGAALDAVADEVARMLSHLALGAWGTVTIETGEAVWCAAPGPGDTVVLVRAAATMAPGAVRRALAEARVAAEALVAEGGA